SMLGVRLVPLGQVDPWYADGCPLVVRQAGLPRWARLLTASGEGRAVAVRDAGYTEVAPGSCTVIADWVD
ncbi:MAG: peptidyl-tRNA hydrolase, partial [Gordonia sp. (in: high G+C Gram-positive bacteria)]